MRIESRRHIRCRGGSILVYERWGCFAEKGEGEPTWHRKQQQRLPGEKAGRKAITLIAYYAFDWIIYFLIHSLSLSLSLSLSSPFTTWFCSSFIVAFSIYAVLPSLIHRTVMLFIPYRGDVSLSYCTCSLYEDVWAAPHWCCDRNALVHSPGVYRKIHLLSLTHKILVEARNWNDTYGYESKSAESNEGSWYYFIMSSNDGKRNTYERGEENI